MLKVSGLNAGYGASQVLHDVSLTVAHGEVVSLLGRNGAGKTTTLRAIAGVGSVTSGEIVVDGVPLRSLPPHEVARTGISLVPETRDVFAMLSVRENLAIAQRTGSAWTEAMIYRLFPALERRRQVAAGKLSGGEQQMLSIGRALMTGPRLVLLDEPTEGLAPAIVNKMVEDLRGIAATGIAMLLVEQNSRVCRSLASRHYVIETGRIVFSGSEAELDRDNVEERFIGLHAA